ncbi:MAG: hypothetical protein ACO1NM_04215 [Sphingobium phenoxybenzoativorans]|uniref:DUF2637 domain-containing protein n=1 Tax=Sphingobium phenoxybenzoativorans TaxID=1592790 RepID=A0A975K4K5_9SPHN|nr:hypothetical protein [Sphingobium phenoxybenzoativorans]QUT04715.1 hypothetical protein KFK14_16965 [Sphingobium phenoxybenzoativorans]
MTLLHLYVIFTLCCCGYALAAGGVTGRAGAAVILIKTVLDLSTAWIDYSWQGTMYPLLFIDVVCLACFMVLAMRSDRLWPLWAAGFQFVAVLIHLATFWQIDVAPKAYQALQQVWTIPMQLAMLSGIMADQRSRFAKGLFRREPDAG